eukprot:CAMPEP_0175859756 /NCGR_PEP_ID=MMETSP0107_2-20121207/30435_1 /TAXON_ID=195067 ORGANISM="Goniomonas pacifica, Strain CCMP1869" /NCGR_SAMPLE_ID=MMETSP0107_2 /ASSEMBLY_ACC=CAM_ASM_000203 /LENGTH=97 /DNA_ID=CAMNT_0017176417 /DNA_START=1 /DNA_END=294 /DNA_ORIENTATION=-
MTRAWGRAGNNITAANLTARGLPPDYVYHVLLPIADLFNHRTGYSTVTFDTNETSHVLATGNISRGSEIYVSYGPKCNRQLLLHYGFAVPRAEDIPC